MGLTVPESVIPLVLKAMRANKPFVTEAGARKHLKKRYLRPIPFGPPARLRGVRLERRLSDPSGWPVYDVHPAKKAFSRPATDGVVVYLHGGGWVNEIASQHWQIIARIARETGQRVVVPIYPLLPLGNAREVCEKTVNLVRAEVEAPKQVRIAGDSSGGQIALSVAMKLRDAGIDLQGITLLAPALDLTWTNPEIDIVQPSDPWLGVPGGRILSEAWRGSDEVTDPVVSPLFGDMSGLGPMTILVGTRDVLNPDAHQLRRKAEEAGVSVTWHEAQGQLHVFALLPTKAGELGAQQIVASLQPVAPGK
ncbi:alpha/beta hydrolase fold domain-containing protein [Glutamicibacter sp.]|uniref:alpha/beta hydrolase fold domain-containing protein n=1 Tax=Glutamicibacter sp. TaxID=1931995 RepID=UPI002B493446|nr:alpha/beta hydrolase fold domain-containing protein [Glutamicibacter sp.]HJX78292.1 alpha/beta hydrolase fold domain-containing protein [Glutamicibacter sp.]